MVSTVSHAPGARPKEQKVHMPLPDMLHELLKYNILQDLKRPLKSLDQFKGGMSFVGSDYFTSHRGNPNNPNNPN